MNVEDIWCLTFNRRGPAHTQPDTLPPTAERLSIFPVPQKTNRLMYGEIDEIMKSDQRSNDDEKQVNEVVNNIKRWTGALRF